MVASVKSSTVSNWADSVFSKLDTKNQGYIEKSDLQSALSAASDATGKGGQPIDVDGTFSALDGDGDGKVTKSEMTDAMTKVADQLNAQFDASRVARGGQQPDGPRGAGGPHGAHGGGSSEGAGSTDSTGGTSTSTSTSTDYVAAADTDGDGTVSDAEQAAYQKKLASGQAQDSSSTHQKDPMREFAHALQLLKAYADNSGNSGAPTASTSTDASASSISVEA